MNNKDMLNFFNLVKDKKITNTGWYDTQWFIPESINLSNKSMFGVARMTMRDSQGFFIDIPVDIRIAVPINEGFNEYTQDSSRWVPVIDIDKEIDNL